MKELFEAIESKTALYFLHVSNMDVDKLVAWANELGPGIVQTGGKDYAIVQHKDDPSDHSNRTEYFDWHSDGLYHAKPPRFVLLHCLNPGSGEAQTDVASSMQVLKQMSSRTLRTLAKLRSHYIGHGGCYSHPIRHSAWKMLLASRGYVSPLEEIPLEDQPSIREISDAIRELYLLLDENAIPQEWKAGNTLIFDQYKYMHRRNSSGIDKERKLIRMWLN